MQFPIGTAAKSGIFTQHDPTFNNVYLLRDSSESGLNSLI
jgi:hypothetical protein